MGMYSIQNYEINTIENLNSWNNAQNSFMKETKVHKIELKILLSQKVEETRSILEAWT